MPPPCKQCSGSDLLALKTKRQSKANLWIFLVGRKKKRCFVDAITDLTLIKWKGIVAISEEGAKFQINLRTYLIQAMPIDTDYFSKGGFPKLTLKNPTPKMWKMCILEETTNKQTKQTLCPFLRRATNGQNKYQWAKYRQNWANARLDKFFVFSRTIIP